MDVRLGDILVMKKSIPAVTSAGWCCARAWIFVCAVSAADMR